MEFGWFHEEEGALSELNITPLVDVALVLLIIFMITAPMMVQGVNVSLPKTRPLSQLPSGNIFVTVNEDFEIFMNEDETAIELSELEERIYPLAQLGQAVYLRADESITHGQVMDVMAAVYAAGAQINIVGEIAPPDAR